MPATPQELAFSHRQRVRFGETDLQGVVYYANYLVYAEVGRFAFLRHLGLDYQAMLERGMDFTIAEARVKYLAPLRFDDEFDIQIGVGELRRSSWSFQYRLTRAADGQRCAEMETVQVMLDRRSGRPTRIPAELARLLDHG